MGGLNLYDLHDNVAHLNTVAMDVLGLGAALHVGVEILGDEWSYGVQGVSVTSPKNHPAYSYRQTVQMGQSPMPRKQIEDLLMSIQDEWTCDQYDIFTRNCNTFCEA